MYGSGTAWGREKTVASKNSRNSCDKRSSQSRPPVITGRCGGMWGDLLCVRALRVLWERSAMQNRRNFLYKTVSHRFQTARRSVARETTPSRNHNDKRRHATTFPGILHTRYDQCYSCEYDQVAVQARALIHRRRRRVENVQGAHDYSLVQFDFGAIRRRIGEDCRSTIRNRKCVYLDFSI